MNLRLFVKNNLGLIRSQQVVMMNPGERAADDAWGYLWDTTYSGLIAKKAKAATVVLEREHILQTDYRWLSSN